MKLIKTSHSVCFPLAWLFPLLGKMSFPIVGIISWVITILFRIPYLYVYLNDFPLSSNISEFQIPY